MIGKKRNKLQVFLTYQSKTINPNRKQMFVMKELPEQTPRKWENKKIFLVVWAKISSKKKWFPIKLMQRLMKFSKKQINLKKIF